MFWDKLIPLKFYAKSEVCAVEVCFTDEGRTYYYSQLRNKNNKLELVATGSVNNALVLPVKIVKEKIPLFIVINGKGVILKKITIAENSEQSTEEIIRQNLPAIHLEDFYAQLFKQEDGSAYIAVCRREQLEGILSELEALKCELCGVLLGAPAIIGLQPLWTNFNSIPTSTQQVELSNNVLEAIETTQQRKEVPVEIDGLSFSADYTLGFSGGLSYLMRRQIAENYPDDLNHVQQRHFEKNKFRFLLILAVGIAFFVAVVNVIFYTSYFDKNNKLETELSVYQGKYEQINQLLADYQQNKNLIENAGVLNRNKLSEYADRIGKTLPDEVVLTDLYFNPVKEEEMSEDSLMTFRNKSLTLKGNCSKSFIVNEWINVLKMQRFIKDVNLEKFVYTNEGLLPNFEINVITE